MVCHLILLDLAVNVLQLQLVSTQRLNQPLIPEDLPFKIGCVILLNLNLIMLLLKTG